MAAREFQSYTSKRSVNNFVNAVDVVDAAEQPRRRGTRCSEAKNIHCRGGFRVVAIQWKLSKMPPPPGRRVAAPENPLRWRISLCHSVETYDQDAAAWKEGNKGYQSDQIHCGGGARSGTRRGCGKIVASEDFASFLIYVFVRSSFSPLFFSFLLNCLVYVYMFNFIGCLPNLLSLCCPCCPCGVQSHLASYPMRLRCP